MRILQMIPIIGIGSFALLLRAAIAVYPGGNRFDLRATEYSLLRNFWCDLLDPVTVAGGVNPSRPWAIAAASLLCLSLVAFWWRVPELFQSTRFDKFGIRFGGITAVTAAIFVFTPAHDFIIQAAFPLGTAALVSTGIGLARAKRFGLLALCFIFIACALANYLFWETGALPLFLPVIQKFAFGSFFLWVIVCSFANESPN